MCLKARDNRDLYHIALSVAKYIAFCETKYIAQACLYIDKKELTMEQNKNILREESICFAIEISDICDNIKDFQYM